jgi:hypothetical protein
MNQPYLESTLGESFRLKIPNYMSRKRVSPRNPFSQKLRCTRLTAIKKNSTHQDAVCQENVTKLKLKPPFSHRYERGYFVTPPHPRFLFPLTFALTGPRWRGY